MIELVEGALKGLELGSFSLVELTVCAAVLIFVFKLHKIITAISKSILEHRQFNQKLRETAYRLGGKKRKQDGEQK